ncbi:hypothetical protein [Gorillibacterium massiliense]|uniref:hypothetical protein n=1 Tax=Gorillibacterium massiliense TaxID=1280390 RepID=UPI000693765A|nr:hypothetical protein [Gorillibacterium massiliense]
MKRMIRYIPFFLLLAILTLAVPAPAVQAAPDDRIVIKCSPDALYTTSMPLPKKWKVPLQNLPQSLTAVVPVSDVYLQTAKRTYVLDEDFRLYDPADSIVYTLPAAIRKQLRKDAAALKVKHYGRLMSWQEAQTAIPRMAFITVTDVETGLQFRVQRRAGSSHADVQPLSRADTAIMKDIYSGEWSWRRRGILVQKDGGEVIAASMHGMPHGGDGIPDNGFDGHFCIHFLGSVTHGSGNQDPDHEVMIHKAAGQLIPYVRQFSPEHLAQLVVIGINQQDAELLSVLFADRNKMVTIARQLDLAHLGSLRDISIRLTETPENAPLTAEAVVHATAHRSGGKRPITMNLGFARSAPGLPWALDTILLR